jgi:hypothetical protein
LTGLIYEFAFCLTGEAFSSFSLDFFEGDFIGDFLSGDLLDFSFEKDAQFVILALSVVSILKNSFKISFCS